MRALPDALRVKLDSGVTTLAHVWRMVRRDGARFAFTDHDAPLAFDDLIAEPVQGISAGAIEKSTGFGVDSASISGVLSSDAISDADLARGLWDSARVEIWRLDWSSTADRVHLFAGHIGDVRRGAQAFEAELRGLQAPFNVPVGRVFSRFCDADVGDARCGVDLDAPAFCGVGAIIEVLSSHAFKASGLGEFADEWFSRGRIVWDDGQADEISTHRLHGDAAIIELLGSTTLAIGTVFTVYAGCGKRLATCCAKFANTVNFRGFPHMPGNDALQAGPQAGDRLDGSSRQT